VSEEINKRGNRVLKVDVVFPQGVVAINEQM
jgi:hypothetical protein